MGNRLTADEAVELADGIREEWIVLVSMLAEAAQTTAWVSAGFDRPTEWLGELPALPVLTLHVGEVEQGALPAAKQRTARVSRPGAKQIARPQARQR